MLERHRRSPRNLTLNDVFPSWKAQLNGGVFMYIKSITQPGGLSWLTSGLAYQLDLVYHGTRSGNKFISPAVYNFLDDDGVMKTDAFTKNLFGLMAIGEFEEKWNHLHALYNTVYNPLHSYEITETRERELERSEDVTDTRTPDISAARTLNLSDVQTHPTKTTTVESTRTPDLSESTTAADDTTVEESSTKTTTHGHVVTTESDSEGTTSNNRYGFNTTAEGGVPSSVSTTSGSTDTTETHSGEDEDALAATTSTERDTTATTRNTGTEEYEESNVEAYTGQDILSKTGSDTTRTTGTDENVHDGTIGETETVELTRTGNLFKSPSELLSIDREFWMTPFWNIVFDDLDSILTLQIYSEAPIYNKIF